MARIRKPRPECLIRPLPQQVCHGIEECPLVYPRFPELHARYTAETILVMLKDCSRQELVEDLGLTTAVGHIHLLEFPSRGVLSASGIVSVEPLELLPVELLVRTESDPNIHITEARHRLGLHNIEDFVLPASPYVVQKALHLLFQDVTHGKLQSTGIDVLIKSMICFYVSAKRCGIGAERKGRWHGWR